MPKHVQNTACAVAIGLGLLASSTVPVLAQTTPTPADNAATTANANNDKAPNGSLEKYHGLLRTSELNGANVYNDQGTAIGTVNDMLVGDDGKVQNVVISVGGFLGIGTHYVSVPFNQIQVQPSRSGNTGMVTTNSTATTGTTTPAQTMASPEPNTTATGAGMATTGTTTNGDMTPATTANNNMATGNASRVQYFSVVLPGATKDSLTKTPEFHYRG